MNKIRMGLYLLIGVFILAGCGLVPNSYPPYVNITSNQLPKIKKVLLVGPNFEHFKGKLSSEEEAKLRQIWQNKLITTYNKKAADAKIRYIFVHKPEADQQLVELESQMKLPSKYDEKTGKISELYIQTYKKDMQNIVAQLAKDYSVDGVLRLSFVVLHPPLQMGGREVCWDGICVNPSEINLKTFCLGLFLASGNAVPDVNYSGRMPVVSLSLKLYDRQGNLLLKGRAGYQVLKQLDFITNSGVKTLKLEKVFSPSASWWNKQYSRACINIAVNILLDPQKYAQKSSEYQKEMKTWQ